MIYHGYIKGYQNRLHIGSNPETVDIAPFTTIDVNIVGPVLRAGHFNEDYNLSVIYCDIIRGSPSFMDHE